jgi:dephospho-CoA kinase
MALNVGITGGIGSGKTTICKIFETLGIPVYYADDRAKYLMSNDLTLINGIKELFGNEAYLDKKLNRKFISDIVFNNPEELKALNNLVHPAVQKDGIVWHNSQQNTPYTLREAALLIESGTYKHLDKLIVVIADESLRLERVIARDNTDINSVKKRMQQQMQDEERLKYADFVIDNNGQNSLLNQVYSIHQKLMLLIKEK